MAENDRDQSGRFTKGNQAAVTHGRFSASVLAEADTQIAERVAELVAEQGEVSGIRLGLIRDYAAAEVLAAHALRVVEQLGLHGRRGAQTFTIYQRLVDRKAKLAKMIGLGRTTKPTTLAAEIAAIHAGDAA